MICWDCIEGLGEQRPTSAVCTHCGAAVCRDHAVAQAMRLTAVVGMGRQDEVTSPARRILCRICDAAEQDRRLTAQGTPVRWRRGG